MLSESVQIVLDAVDQASDVIASVTGSLQGMESSAGDMGTAMAGVGAAGAAAGEAIGGAGDELDDTNMTMLESVQGMQGLSGVMRMGIGDFEQYQMLQIRGQAATLAVQKAQDTLNKVMETAASDNQKVVTTQAEMIAAQENYQASVAKYGETSKQATQALAEYTKAQTAYKSAVDAASKATQQITVDQEALRIAQERAQYYQERTNLDYLMMATQAPMFISGIAKSAETIGGLGDALFGGASAEETMIAAMSGVGGTAAGVTGTIAEFAGGLTVAGVAAGAVVAGVVVAAGAIVATGASIAMAHEQGERYVDTYSRWAANIHQTMPGITGDIVAAAGMVAAGWLQMGQDLQTKGVPAIEQWAGGVSKGLTGAGGWVAGMGGDAVKDVQNFGASIGQGFMSMFGPGGTVHSYLTLGAGYLQQLWSNIWSPTGSGASGYTNMGQMVSDAFLGPAGIAFQFPQIFSQLTSKVAPAITDFTKSIGDSFSGIFGGIGIGGMGAGVGSGITQVISEITTQFSQLGARLTPILTTLRTTLTDAFSPIQSAISDIGAGWNAFVSGLRTDYSDTLKKLTDAFGVLDTAIQGVVADASAFVAKLGAVPAEVKSTITVIADDAVSTVEKVIGDLASIVSKTITITVNEIWNDLTGWLSNPQSGDVPTGPLPSRQHGGPVTEGWWYLHDNEYVIPAGQIPHAPSTAVPTQHAIALTNTTNLRLDGQLVWRQTEQRQIQRRLSASAWRMGLG